MRRFPIISSHVFTADGGKYDVSRVLNYTTYEFNLQGYDGYRKMNLSIFFIYAYGLGFATLAATISHVVLSMDGIFVRQPGLNVITELIIGYIYSGKPLANLVFKTYGYISTAQAIMFLQDFKLGHYIKVPPKSMSVVQLVGTVVASSVYFGMAWWLLTTVENVCDPSKLPEGSPWTCPGDGIFYNASIIWGVVGPLRMFGRLGLYSKKNYFIIGILSPLPVWLLSRMFPEQKWIKLINMQIIIGGAGALPAAWVVNY
ncbi:hypothetical protein CRYUN_Cryun37aG0136200 [Craigia yunnanensis]